MLKQGALSFHISAAQASSKSSERSETISDRLSLASPECLVPNRGPSSRMSAYAFINCDL